MRAGKEKCFSALAYALEGHVCHHNRWQKQQRNAKQSQCFAADFHHFAFVAKNGDYLRRKGKACGRKGGKHSRGKAPSEFDSGFNSGIFFCAVIKGRHGLKALPDSHAHAEN